MSLEVSAKLSGLTPRPVYIPAMSLPRARLTEGTPSEAASDQANAADQPNLESLEDGVATPLAKAFSESDTRVCIQQLLDDQVHWQLVRAVEKAATTEWLSRVVSAEERQPFDWLADSPWEPQLNLGWRLVQARTHIHLMVLDSFPGKQAPVTTTPSHPMAFMSEPLHPRVKKALLGGRMADVAMFGLGSTKRYTYRPAVFGTLVNVWVDGQKQFLPLAVALAKGMGVHASLDDELLSGCDEMDISVLAAEMAQAQAGRARLLREARESGKPIYPAPEDA